MKRWAWVLPLLALLAAVGWGLRVEPLPLPALDYSVQVLDHEGVELRRYLTPGGYWRLPLRLEQVDPQFIRLLLAYEDKRFFDHHGVDPLALMRALGQWLWHGRIVSGASTLSMQTVRLMRPRSRTLRHKAQEMIQAWRLERRWSKQEILERYLTLAPYGGNLQGLRAASLAYFDKEPQRLNLSEIALLIALPQAPEARRPDRHPQAARMARNRVLDRFLEQQSISAEQWRLARARPVPTRRIQPPMLAPHLADRLRRQMPDRQTLVTTLDAGLQQRLQQLARQQRWLHQGESLAVLVVEHHSGRLLAHLGSGDYLRQSQIDLSRVLRSPGSALKPFIYGLGFDLDLMHPETRVLDQPWRANGYAPASFSGRYQGEVSLRQALQQSLNIPAVKALQAVGPVRWLQWMRRTGVRLVLPRGEKPGLALALGGLGIDLEGLTALYAAIARGGRFIDVVAMPEILQQEHDFLGSSAAAHLRDVLQGSTAPRGFTRTRSLAYKTGTSYGYRDAWALGFDAGYTIGVWVGRPDGGAGDERTGFRAAAPLLFQAFALLPRPEPASEPAPPRLTQAQLPRRLRWLGEGEMGANQVAPAPRIRFPLDGSSVWLNSSALTLKAQNGVPPLRWFVDGQLLPLQGDGHQMQWQAAGPGQVDIRLVDALGRSDQVGVWLESVAQSAE